MNTLTKLYEAVTSQLHDEEGAAMVEYGLLIFFIALAVIAVLIVLGPAIAAMFEEVVVGIGGTAPTS